MSIIDFSTPEKVNPYTATVTELIAAGEGKASEIVVPTDEANKARVAFSKAANEQGKTARLRINEPDEKKNTVRMVFTLTDKHRARRGATETAPADVAATDSAPVE